KAALVKLRYFTGLTLEEAAEVVGMSRATADRHWGFAKAWLYRRITRTDGPAGEGVFSVFVRRAGAGSRTASRTHTQTEAVMEPKNIDQVFWDAAQLATMGERAAYLDRACAGDPERRRQVEELLEARAAAGSFLETPVVARDDVAGDDTRTGPSAPDDEVPLDFLAPSSKPGTIGRL